MAGIRAAISAGLAVGVLPQGALTNGVRQLSLTVLPQLENTPLVITRSAAAPARLADDLVAIVKRTVQALVVEPAAHLGATGKARAGR